MKSISKVNALSFAYFFFYAVILIYPTSLWATTVQMEGLPKPSEMVLTSKDDISRHIWIAGQYLKAGHFKAVIVISEQVLSMNQNHINAHALLAAAHKGSGDEEEFNKEAALLKKLAPNSPALYLYLSKAYLAFKDSKKAESSYRKGLKTASEKTELRMGLAALFLKEGRVKEAEDQYLKVLKKKGLELKHFLNANFALCRIGLQQKAYDRVIKRAMIVTDLYSPIPQAHHFLGAAYLGKGQPEQAVTVYKKLMEVNPKSPVSYQELALISIDKLGDYEKALHYAKEAAQKFPKDAKSQDVLGWVYYQKEKYPEALRQFQAAVRLGGKNPQYSYHLGLAHQKLGDNVKAKEAFERALGLIDTKQSKEFAEELKSRIDQCKQGI